MGINLNDYDVIYKERVYKCLDMQMEFRDDGRITDSPFEKPNFLTVCCINEDGTIILIRDEAWMFRFVRKGRDSNG